MSVQIFHNPKCSTSRKVLLALQEAGVEPQVIEYLKTPPSETQLKEILRIGNLKPQDILRKRDKVFKEKFADKSLSDAQWIKAISEHPSILERPLCVSEDHAAICRPIDRWKEFV